MEMPIWVVIALLVAVVVGSMIVMFAQEMLRIEIWPHQADYTGRLIFMERISSGEIARLVEACFNESYGQKLENAFCYAITTDEQVSVNAGEIESRVDLEPEHFSVDSGSTRSISIYWNYFQSIVEVRI